MHPLGCPDPPNYFLIFGCVSLATDGDATFGWPAWGGRARVWHAHVHAHAHAHRDVPRRLPLRHAGCTYRLVWPVGRPAPLGGLLVVSIKHLSMPIH